MGRSAEGWAVWAEGKAVRQLHLNHTEASTHAWLHMCAYQSTHAPHTKLAQQSPIRGREHARGFPY